MFSSLSFPLPLRMAVFALLLCPLALAARAQTAGELNITPTDEFTQYPIAIPPFATGGPQMREPVFSTVVLADLEQTGMFTGPRNPQFAAETHQLDLANDTIHYSRWYSIGVFYLVKGQYEVANNEVEVTIRVYDTVSQNYIFGYRYPAEALTDARKLAHRISDDIIKRLMNIEGVASTRILFVKQMDATSLDKRVTVMDVDGKNMTQLSPPGELTATPCWGKNSGEIFYTTYRQFNPDLEGMILATGERWFVSRRAGFNLSPAWSQVTERIALTLTKDGNSELYLMGRDGRDLQRLTKHIAIDSSPVWSPDGKRIAFQSDRAGSPQIYILDLDTYNVNRLTYSSTYNDGASWSPDGELIAFSSRDKNGVYQICTVRPDGTDLRTLTTGASNSEDPSWAPNSLMLAFTSDRTGRKQIYTMLKNGANVRQITFEGYHCQSPAWMPFPPPSSR